MRRGSDNGRIESVQLAHLIAENHDINGAIDSLTVDAGQNKLHSQLKTSGP